MSTALVATTDASRRSALSRLELQIQGVCRGLWLVVDAELWVQRGAPGGRPLAEALAELVHAELGADDGAERILVILEWPAELAARSPLHRHGADPQPDAAPVLSVMFAERVHSALAGAWDLVQIPPKTLSEHSELDAWINAATVAGQRQCAEVRAARRERRQEGGRGDGDARHSAPLALPNPDAPRARAVWGWLNQDLSLTTPGLGGLVASRPHYWRYPVAQAARGAALIVLGTLLFVVMHGATMLAIRLVAPRPPDPAPSFVAERWVPASACTLANPRYVEALRAQVFSVSRPGLSQGGARWDAQADLCGLFDRELDGWVGTLEDHARPDGGNLGDAAAAQACFELLGRPEVYADQDAQARGIWADPERLLRSEDTAVSALAGTVKALRASCAAHRPLLADALRGAILATHVGGLTATSKLAPLVNLPNAAGPRALRAHALEVATSGAPVDQSGCVSAGSRLGWEGGDYPDLCATAIDPADPLRALAGDLSQDTEPSVVRRYTQARFGPTLKRAPGAGPDAPVWACHQALIAGTRATTRLGRWGLPIPVPGAYDVTAAHGAKSQLQVESAIGGRADGLDLGACWSLIADTLTSWTPAYPLVAEVKAEGWPDAAQRVCGQLCAVGYGLADRAGDALWATPSEDLALCLHLDPTRDWRASATPAGFPALTLPWSGEGEAAPPSYSPNRRVAPTAEQVCAFHLIAQGQFSPDDPKWLPAGLEARSWAGERRDPRVSAGGDDGWAAWAIEGFAETGLDHRWGERECASAALTCFGAIALETVEDPLSRLGWAGRYDARARELARLPAEDLAASHPWCALVQPYLKPVEQRDQADATCRAGVLDARDAIAEALRRAEVPR